MKKPLAIDLYCGLGGWTEGLLAEGFDVIGFDIEQHAYGEHRYPAQLVVQDVLTLHGSQFKDAALIVASPPCQEYSYMAMPWSLAKAKAKAIRADATGKELERLNQLFSACFRIQKEASFAAGHIIPLVVENVKGAQPWVGRARWNFGSFYLWGDVPALMPVTFGRQVMKVGIAHRSNGATNFHGQKSPGQKVTNRNPVHALAGIKGSEGYERDHPDAFGWKKPGTSSKSPARKMASAMIAKIPLPLSRHIARTYMPRPRESSV